MPKDEFEQLLERCSERLAEITLDVPTLESASPRWPVYSLTPPAAPPKPAAPPPARPEPPKAAAPPPTAVEQKPPPAPVPAPVVASVVAPVPAPVHAPRPPAVEEREEDEVFPPPRVRPRTPPPPVPLWRARPEPTPVPRPAPRDRRRPALAGAAAALAAAGAFGVWLARRSRADLQIEVGEADAMAVRPEQGDLLVAKGKELLDISHDGRTLGRRPLDASVDSLSWNQGSLWSADGLTTSVVEHADGGRATSFRLNHVPSALYVKGRYLWTAERGGHALHQFLISRSILGAMLQPIDSFELNGLSPESFTIDDAGTLWLADEPTRRIFRLRLENGSYKKISSAALSPFVGPEGRLRDLTVEDDAVWILAQPAASRRTVLRRIRLSRFDWTPA